FLTMEALYRLSYAGVWLRGPDSNRQPSDYEPDELPLLHPASIGGGGRIRTCEGCASRFTVCPRWPLGYPSTYSVVRAAGRVRPPLPGGTVTLHRRPHHWLYHPNAVPSRSVGQPPPSASEAAGAGDGTRTHNRSLTRRLLCRLSYPSPPPHGPGARLRPWHRHRHRHRHGHGHRHRTAGAAAPATDTATATSTAITT